MCVVMFASSLELPYTIKRSGDGASKDGNRAKKPLSPPPTLAATSGQRKKSASSAPKGKSPGLLPKLCLLHRLIVVLILFLPLTSFSHTLWFGVSSNIVFL